MNFSQGNVATGSPGAMDQNSDLIRVRVNQGANRVRIIQELMQNGMDEVSATQRVDMAMMQAPRSRKREYTGGGEIRAAMLGGLLAAIAGGICWTIIAVVTDYEIGFAAWGMGLLCGWAVVKAAGGPGGFALQWIACDSAVLGIILGKYGIVGYYVQKELFGEVTLDGYLSTEMVATFIAVLPELHCLLDTVWFILAVVTAWKMTRDTDTGTAG